MGNLRQSYQSELDDYFCALPESVKTPTDGAFCQARQKINSNALLELQRMIVDQIYQNPNIKRFYGYRLLAIDGTTLRLNGVNQECRNYFKGLKKTTEEFDGVQLAHASFCYDVLNELCVDARILPEDVGEVTIAHLHLSERTIPGDLVLMDRNYGGFRLCTHLLQRGAQFCIRLKTGQATNLIGDFIASNSESRIVQWDPAIHHIGQCEDLDIEAQPMRVRLVKIILNTGEVEVLVTSLLDEQAWSVDFMCKLYALRWGVEEAYKFAKSRMEIERWSGKNLCAVEQDFYGRVLLATLSAGMSIEPGRVVESIHKTCKHAYQVNQTRAMGIVYKKFAQLMNAPAWKRLSLLDGILHECLKKPCPIRPGRKYPRNFKIRSRDFAFAYKAVA